MVSYSHRLHPGCLVGADVLTYLFYLQGKARRPLNKSPSGVPPGPAGAVLVNTFFWKILVTRVNRNFRPPLTAARRIPDPLLYRLERSEERLWRDRFYI